MGNYFWADCVYSWVGATQLEAVNGEFHLIWLFVSPLKMH